MSPKKRASEVERVITEGEERLEALDPALQDVKQEVQQGAAGRRVLKQGAEDVEMSETETDEEPLKRRRAVAKRKTAAVEEKPSKRRETETEDKAPPPKSKKDKKKKKKAREKGWGRGRSVEEVARSAEAGGFKGLALALHRGVAQNATKRSRSSAVGWRDPRASRIHQQASGAVPGGGKDNEG
jgi:outer membrane biosynthesis protein TonB